MLPCDLIQAVTLGRTNAEVMLNSLCFVSESKCGGFVLFLVRISDALVNMVHRFLHCMATLSPLVINKLQGRYFETM